MMYLYKKDKFSNKKAVSIEELQQKTKMQMAQNYKNVRKEKKITQSEMADITGISQPNIARFEKGNSNPTLEMLVKMAAAMGMEIEITFKELDKRYV